MFFIIGRAYLQQISVIVISQSQKMFLGFLIVKTHEKTTSNRPIPIHSSVLLVLSTDLRYRR